MSITYRLAAVICSACVLNSQGTTTTVAPTTTTAATTLTTVAKTTGKTGNNYIMNYDFNLYTNPPLDTVSAQQIQNAADVAIYALKLNDNVQTVANPTKTTQNINGVEQPVWKILLNIQFPSQIQIDVATSALSAVSFSTDLQNQLRRMWSTAAISKAQLQAPGKGYVPVAIPTTASSTTTTTGKTGNSYIMKYDFNLYTNPPLDTVSAQQIQNAADVAIYALKIKGEIQTVANPTKTTQNIDGVDQPVWEVLLNIQFPSQILVNVATSALSAVSFSDDLQNQLRRVGISTAAISKAQLQAPGEGYVPVAIPTIVSPKMVQDCNKSPVVGGLLTFFLGGFGAGRFYYGYIGMGVGWLFWTLFAHIGTCVGQGLMKAGNNCMIAGAIIAIPAALSQIGVFIWWIHDLVVMFNKELKPFGMEDCEFSD